MKHEESRLQTEAVRYCRIKGYRTIKGNYEGKIDARSGAREKKMGYEKGTPDLVVLTPGDTFFIEFKTATGRQTPEQKEMQKWYEKTGRKYFVCRSVNEFINILKNHIK
ncbi:MAG: VRR-NUC domain-containing protein [Bacteroidales bacterium]|jgi:hypothetical protein|nr:VRR-NUC domain-containing protein [Bacteroidales bacterium]